MLILVVFALALECGVMRAEDIQVEKWPEDVPCDAIKKNPDGSYTQTKDLIMDRIRMEKEHLCQGFTRGARLGSEVRRQKCLSDTAVTGPADSLQSPKTISADLIASSIKSAVAASRLALCVNFDGPSCPQYPLAWSRSLPSRR
jgi:hypothetical protein